MSVRSRKVVGARGGDGPGDLGPLLRCSRGVARAQPSGVGVDLAGAAGLGVDEGERAHPRQVEFAGVDDLDAQHFMAGAERGERVSPGVGRVEPIAEDHDHRPPASDA